MLMMARALTESWILQVRPERWHVVYNSDLGTALISSYWHFQLAPDPQQLSTASLPMFTTAGVSENMLFWSV